MKSNLMGSVFQMGQYHVKHGITCHDRALAIQKGELTVLALSDGMGSPAYKCPELGAQFAVDFIKNNATKFHKLLDCYSKGENNQVVWKKGNGKQFIYNLLKLLRRMEDEATAYAHRIGVGIDDLNCTLSFAVIGPEKMIQAAIGDSPLCVKTNEDFCHLDGNGGLGIDQGTLSAYHIQYAARGMAINVGFSETLQAILMMSDGCLGYEKAEGLNAMEKDFPSWFYDVTQGRASIQDAVQKLVDDGYDDCSFAYYVHNLVA